MLSLLLMACVVAVLPLQGHANPTAETEEMDFLDLVDGEGNVLIQGQGVDAVNAEARAQGARPFRPWATGRRGGTAL
ncbi:MAG: hypothetical protein CM15mP39_10010 [Synechococcus sp.]|nr:MAG: hypothetical protein CM15mP39_10010 [Synechococcus sp.]